jgi:hypothetical protein
MVTAAWRVLGTPQEEMASRNLQKLENCEFL